MKTLFTKRTLHHRALTLGLVAAATLSASVLSPATAHADVVAQARIGKADVRVRLHTPDRVVIHERAPRVVVRHERFDPYMAIRWGHLSREDHRVAARLSLLTGIGERRLLAARSHGWGWKRIGDFYDLHPRVIAQARSHRPLHTAYYDDDRCDDRDDDRDDWHHGKGKGGKGGKGRSR